MVLRLVVLVAVLWGAGPAAAQPVGIVGVGIPPGETDSNIYAISGDGNVALVPAEITYALFLWTRTSDSGGTIQSLPLDHFGYGYSGTTVSGDGQTVFAGGYRTYLGVTTTVAVRWRSPFRALEVISGTGSPSTCTGGWPAAASENGLIVTGSGYECTSGACSWFAYWNLNAGGGPACIVQWPSTMWEDKAGTSISGDGRVIGGYAAYGGSSSLAWVWRSPPTGDGFAHELPLPAGASNPRAVVSRDGQFAVGSAYGADSRGHALRWRLLDSGSEAAEDLGLPPGFTDVSLNRVNADGTVAVGSGSTPSGSRCVLWIQGRGMTDLVGYASSLGVGFGGWTLRAVRGISDDGRTIGGEAFHVVNGTLRIEGFILRIRICGTADFNNDGDAGTDADIEAFFACLAGNCCATCGSADFNDDGESGTDADIEAFFRVLAGGAC